MLTLVIKSHENTGLFLDFLNLFNRTLFWDVAADDHVD
jgi:hypothetical protein